MECVHCSHAKLPKRTSQTRTREDGKIVYDSIRHASKRAILSLLIQTNICAHFHHPHTRTSHTAHTRTLTLTNGASKRHAHHAITSPNVCRAIRSVTIRIQFQFRVYVCSPYYTIIAWPGTARHGMAWHGHANTLG